MKCLKCLPKYLILITHIYFEFDADYENATILNMYVKDNEDKSFLFYPGMKFKTADFPEVEP
jgi:hypothetical protein